MAETLNDLLDKEVDELELRITKLKGPFEAVIIEAVPSQEIFCGKNPD